MARRVLAKLLRQGLQPQGRTRHTDRGVCRLWVHAVSWLSPANPSVAKTLLAVALALGAHASGVAAETFTVTDIPFQAYVINGQNNPTLTLVRGQTYTFNVNTSGHPLWLKSVQGPTKANAYNDGVTNNGVQVGTLTFAVPLGAPSTLFYNCEFHAPMTGTINIVDPSPTATATVTPTPTMSTAATPTPTSTPPTRPCVGDCSEDRQVTVDEILTLVTIALGTGDISTCANGIPNGSSVDVALIIHAVSNALNGCGSVVGTTVDLWLSDGDPGIHEAAVEHAVELRTAIGGACLVLDENSGVRTSSQATTDERSLVLVDLNGGDLEPLDWVAIRNQNRAWLQAVNAGGAGTSTKPRMSAWNFLGGWEIFRVQQVAGDAPISDGDQIALQSWDLRHYLRAVNGGDAEVDAQSVAVSGWEAFFIMLGAPQSRWLEPQSSRAFASGSASAGAITVDEAPTAQTKPMRGFGAAFTESACWLLQRRLGDDTRQAALTSLFDCNAGICLKVMRLPMGPSDMVHEASLAEGTYADTPRSSQGERLNFSLARDEADVIPVVQGAADSARQLVIVASPWSLPAWMKTSGSLVGGTLRSDRQQEAAEYFMRFVEEYANRGITIHAVNSQNEPLLDLDRGAGNPATYPWGYLRPSTEAEFIQSFLAPAFANAGLSPLILAFDHNWVHQTYGNGQPAAYPLEVFAALGSDGPAGGVAFHCYGGTADAQSVFHQAHPIPEIWMTECAAGDFEDANALSPFANKVKLVIDSTRNWATSVILWTLAAELTGGPALTGGCTTCRGLLSIHEGTVTRGVQYYALAHFSRFVRPGALRLDSQGGSSGLVHVAFRNPDGSVVLVVHNQSQEPVDFEVQYRDGFSTYRLPRAGVATFRWQG